MRIFTLVCAVFLTAFATVAEAQPFAKTYGTTSSPIGWSGFCERYEAECKVPAVRPERVTHTPELIKLLEHINDEVNYRHIKPKTDYEHWGVIERWDFAEDGFGDCDEYVLLKRKMLIAAGLPRSALLYTVVWDKRKEGHAVLTVLTTKGDLVLDNQHTEVLPWTKTGYRFVKRQSPEHPGVWLAMRPPQKVAGKK